MTPKFALLFAALVGVAHAWQLVKYAGDAQTFPIFNPTVSHVEVDFADDNGNNLYSYDDVGCEIVFTITAGCTPGDCTIAGGCTTGDCAVIYGGTGVTSATVGAESTAKVYIYSETAATLTIQAALSGGNVAAGCTSTTTNMGTTGGTTTPAAITFSATVIDTCPAGYYYTTTSDPNPITALGQCSACNAGSASGATAAAAGSCPLCPAGEFSSTPASTECAKCPSNTVSEAGSSSCSSCSPGTELVGNKCETSGLDPTVGLVLTIVGIIVGVFALGVAALCFVKKPWVDDGTKA